MELSPQFLLRIIACICIVLFLVFAFLAVTIYRREDIRGVMDDLSGKARQKSSGSAMLSGQSLKQLRQMRSLEESRLKESPSQPIQDPSDESSSSRGKHSRPTEETDFNDSVSAESRSTSRNTRPQHSQSAISANVAEIGGSLYAGGRSFQVTKSLTLSSCSQPLDIE